MEDPLSRSSEKLPLGAMSAWELADHCKQEVSHFCCGDPAGDQYAVELFRRATSYGDQEAWAAVQHCFSETMRGWLRQQPNLEAGCCVEHEEHYVALAFARCWQTITSLHLEFGQLSAALQCLQAHLNGVVLDTLRTYSRLRKVSLPASAEPHAEDQIASLEGWEILQALLPNEREQRLAYLLFHCGLSPREIMHFCPQEWSDVQEVSRLRRNIIERVLGNANQLRWQLNRREQV